MSPGSSFQPAQLAPVGLRTGAEHVVQPQSSTQGGADRRGREDPRPPRLTQPGDAHGVVEFGLGEDGPAPRRGTEHGTRWASSCSGRSGMALAPSVGRIPYM
jgi:hypothetical protein